MAHTCLIALPFNTAGVTATSELPRLLSNDVGYDITRLDPGNE